VFSEVFVTSIGHNFLKLKILCLKYFILAKVGLLSVGWFSNFDFKCYLLFGG